MRKPHFESKMWVELGQSEVKTLFRRRGKVGADKVSSVANGWMPVLYWLQQLVSSNNKAADHHHHQHHTWMSNTH